MSRKDSFRNTEFRCKGWRNRILFDCEKNAEHISLVYNGDCYRAYATDLKHSHA